MIMIKSLMASIALSTALMMSSPDTGGTALPLVVVGESPSGTGDEIQAERTEMLEEMKTKAPETAQGEEHTAETTLEQENVLASNRTQENFSEAADGQENAEATSQSQENPQTVTHQEAFPELAPEEELLPEPVQLTGSQLLMLSSQSGAQMLSAVIRSESGKIVVVDGGWEADGEYLLRTIKKNGGHVDAWLITHPHKDHAGALNSILKNKSSEIEIDKIYYSFAPLNWYEEAELGDGALVSSLLEGFATLPEGTLCDSIGKGFSIDLGDIRITVLNDRYKLFSNPVNNSSMVYLVETGGKRILFLGDMGYDGGFQLLRDSGENLKADIVQMAHHGQYGVDKEVYKKIAPDVCLWPTPQWLWDNDNGGGYDSGSWRTIETRRWMEELGAGQNYCIKDGDILLELN